jgi:hypothetical protein
VDVLPVKERGRSSRTPSKLRRDSLHKPFSLRRTFASNISTIKVRTEKCAAWYRNGVRSSTFDSLATNPLEWCDMLAGSQNPEGCVTKEQECSVDISASTTDSATKY